MGDVTYSAVSSALEQRFRKKLERNPNRATVTLNLLRKLAGRGKNIAWDVSFADGTGQIFDDGADVSVYNSDAYVPATLNWSEYGDAFALTGRAEDAAAGDETEVAELYLNKLREAAERTASKINVDIWSGAGTGSPQKLHGFTASAGPLQATGIYAGIDRTTYPTWAANVRSNGGVVRPVSIGLIEQAFEDTYIASGRVPQACVTTPPIFRRLAETVSPERRYLQEVTIRGQKIVLDGGWQAIEINGVPIFKDKDATSGCFAGLDLEMIEVEYLPVAPARVSRGDVVGMIPIAGTPQEQGTQPPDGSPALMAAVYKLARTGNKSKVQVLATLGMPARRCNSSFLITDLGA